MNLTIYLHLGQGRCGSSSIQRFAADNQATLRELGISYPSPAEMGIATEYNGKANAYPMYRLRRQTPSPLEAFAAFLERQEYPKLLLSSEWLLNAEGAFMRQLVDIARASGANVVALAYVREQREWLISRYAQAVKSRRWVMPLEDYVAQSYRTRKLNYHAIFSARAQLFGRENLVIRLFERPRLRNGDVRVDAFDVMGVDVQELVTDDPETNASASLEELEVMRFLNQRAEQGQFHPREFLRHSQEFWEETGWKPTRDLYRLVSSGLLREAGEHFSSLNEQFRREFFSDEPAPLFSTRIPVDYDQLSEDEWINRRSFGLLANHALAVLERRHTKRQSVATRAASAAPAVGTEAAKKKRASGAADRKAARPAERKTRAATDRASAGDSRDSKR